MKNPRTPLPAPFPALKKEKKQWVSWKKFKKNTVSPLPVHYCGEKDCEGDCGVLVCGCIDICRTCPYDR